MKTVDVEEDVTEKYLSVNSPYTGGRALFLCVKQWRTRRTTMCSYDRSLYDLSLPFTHRTWPSTKRSISVK